MIRLIEGEAQPSYGASVRNYVLDGVASCQAAFVRQSQIGDVGDDVLLRLASFDAYEITLSIGFRGGVSDDVYWLESH